MRYDNAQPEVLVRRLIGALSNDGDHIVDPFLGSGTIAKVCHDMRRRVTGGEINAEAVRFTMTRLLNEHLWPTENTAAPCAV